MMKPTMTAMPDTRTGTLDGQTARSRGAVIVGAWDALERGMAATTSTHMSWLMEWDMHRVGSTTVMLASRAG